MATSHSISMRSTSRWTWRMTSERITSSSSQRMACDQLKSAARAGPESRLIHSLRPGFVLSVSSMRPVWINARLVGQAETLARRFVTGRDLHTVVWGRRKVEHNGLGRRSFEHSSLGQAEIQARCVEADGDSSTVCRGRRRIKHRDLYGGGAALCEVLRWSRGYVATIAVSSSVVIAPRFDDEDERRLAVRKASSNSKGARLPYSKVASFFCISASSSLPAEEVLFQQQALIPHSF